MGILRDNNKKKKKLFQPPICKNTEQLEEMPMFPEHTIEDRENGRWYVRIDEIGHKKEMRVWSADGCENRIKQEMSQGEGWAQKFWDNTSIWMESYTGGRNEKKIRLADPMYSQWALECWQALCTAYDKVTEVERAFGDNSSTIKRGECATKLFGDTDPYAPADNQCPDSFGLDETEATFDIIEDLIDESIPESFGL